MASQAGDATSISAAPSSSPTSLPTTPPNIVFTSPLSRQIDTCTSQLVSWSTVGIISNENNSSSGGDANSTSTGTAIADTNPLSVLLIGIAGLYTQPSNISTITNVSDPPTLYIFAELLFTTNVTNLATNFTFDTINVPAGFYNFFATLIVQEQVETGSQDGQGLIIPVETLNFTSIGFEVRNGSDTGCVTFPDATGTTLSLPTSLLPNPALDPDIASGSGSTGTSSSSEGTHRSAGAIAGITVGSIFGAVVLLSLISILLRRSGRSRTRTWWVHRTALPHSNSRRLPLYSPKGYLQRIGVGRQVDSNGRDRKDASGGDFIGLQSLDDTVRLPASST